MNSAVDPGRSRADIPAIDKETINLVKAQPGRGYKVVGIAGGCEIQTRLASLGILPGQTIRIIRPSRIGPVLVCVKGSKVALGHGISRKILVGPQKPEMNS